MNLRENWRIVLLTVFVVGSTLALLGPVLPMIGGASGLTGLEYGLELSGGTRIRAPLVGMTAENVDFGQNPPTRANITETVAGELGIARTDVAVKYDARAVEINTTNDTTAEIKLALAAAGIGGDQLSIRDGVTTSTRPVKRSSG